MRYLQIDTCDFNNGNGIRVTLWVSGCPLHCKGCHNKQSWDKNNGKLFTEDTYQKLVKLLDNKYIKGLSILGGEPLAPYNKDEVLNIIKRVKKDLPNKDIWLWTGYNEDELNIKQLFNIGIDTVIYGRFVEELKVTGEYYGSSNQKIVNKGDI